ncbi:Inner membrane protein yeiU [Tatumella ptyseos]|uniref:Inner membrane protein yeiU n=1 Tax=Tatumella ptyseos TaxID=82987 RepID=A0A2X5NQ83_9GAMM|nr:Inner membrane protein yeiU [Tatumella ptyseos]
MRLSRLMIILLLNALGIALFFSWYLPEHHGFWFGLDKAIFFGFNNQMVTHHAFAIFVAITNFRGFDLVSLIAMDCSTIPTGGKLMRRVTIACWLSV